MSLLQTLPATERAFRDTTVAKAPSTALDALASMYQLPRPGNIDTEAWRQALRAVLWTRRGTRSTIHAFLEKAWTPQWATKYICNVPNPTPQTLTWVSGGVVGGFTKADVNRLFRIGTGLYRSVGPAFNAGPAVSATLNLCPVTTAYWQGANFAQGAVVQAIKLPFVWSDFDAKFSLVADVDASAPPTYMQPQVRWQASAAGGVQGAQNTFYASDATDLPVWAEPAPAGQLPGYVVTAATAGTWRNLFFNADHDPNNPNAVPARGGTYDVTLLKLTAGVWGPTALTCTLAADSKTAFDTTHSVVLAAGDQVSLYIAANNGVNQPVLFPKGSIYIDPPAGEPPGGYIMPNGAANPSTADGAAGLVPLYLNGGLDESLMLCVRRLLAAGVVLDTQVADFVNPDGYW